MSKDFDIGFRVFCCLGFKKEFWFLFFSLSFLCFLFLRPAGESKRFVLEASFIESERRAKRHTHFLRAQSVLLFVLSKEEAEAEEPPIYFLWSSSRRTDTKHKVELCWSRERIGSNLVKQLKNNNNKRFVLQSSSSSWASIPFS